MFVIAGFFLIAFIYSSVGFGGGSSYLALLSLTAIDYQYIPLLALSCNLVVVAIGYRNFNSIANLPKLTYVLILISAPFAWLGALVQVTETFFFSILAIALILSGSIMILQANSRQQQDFNVLQIGKHSRHALLIICIPISFLAGIVGIGGGIFLAPVLHLIKFANAKQIATITTMYILINSVSGIVGQLTKIGSDYLLAWHNIYSMNLFLLPIIVAIAAQLGSYIGAYKLHLQQLQTICASLIILVGLRLAYQSFCV